MNAPQTLGHLGRGVLRLEEENCVKVLQSFVTTCCRSGGGGRSGAAEECDLVGEREKIKERERKVSETLRFTLKVSFHEKSVRTDDCRQSNSPLVWRTMSSLPSSPSSRPPPPSRGHAAPPSPTRASCSSSSSVSAHPVGCSHPPRLTSSRVFRAWMKKRKLLPEF